METEKLICLAIEGDKEALIRLIMDKKDEYYRLAYVFLNNKEDTMDALQDMIIILFKNIKKLRNKEYSIVGVRRYLLTVVGVY